MSRRSTGAGLGRRTHMRILGDAAAGASGPPALTLPTTNLLAAWDWLSSVTDAGAGKVSGYADRSGNGNHLVQLTGGKQPVISAAYAPLGGVDCIDYRPTGVLTSAGLSSAPTDWTIYVVCDLTVSAAQALFWDFAVGRIFAEVKTSTGYRAKDDTVFRTFGTTADLSDGPQVLRWTAAAAGNISLHKNGALLGSVAWFPQPLGGAFGIGGAFSAIAHIQAVYAAAYIYSTNHDSTAADAVEAWITQETGL